MRRLASALVLCVALAAAPSRAAQPETGCPGSWTGTGEATYYVPVGGNACMLPVGPDEFFAAVPAATFDGSAACGRCVQVTGPLGTIVARVTDLCVGPGCRDFDLSPSAFAAIGDPVDGIIPVSWESVACDVTGPIAFYFDPSSNPYFAQIQVRNQRYGVASFELAESGAPYVPVARTAYDQFEYLSSPNPIAAPLSIRVTDLHGSVVESTGVPFAAGAVVDGAGQFAVCPEPGGALAGMAAFAALGLVRRARTP